MTQYVVCPRRYYLLKRQWYVQLEDYGAAGVWRAKQEAISGTAFPSTFPFLTALAAAGYSKKEDLTGADESELVGQGFMHSEAEAILTALAAL